MLSVFRQNLTSFAISLVCCSVFFSGCGRLQSAEKTDSNNVLIQAPKLIISNPLPQSRKSALIELSIASNKQLRGLQNRNLKLDADGESLATQWVDRDFDGKNDHLIALADFAAGETREFTLSAGKIDVDKKVQADFWLRDTSKTDPEGLTRLAEYNVPVGHTSKNKIFKYEGVGWESDKVGYRLYLDERNVIDIFGKKVSDLVLHDVGINGGYHDMAPWGMDILKVGNSLGIGGIGAFVDGKVERVEKTAGISYREIANGPLEATVQISQAEWRVGAATSDISTRYHIHGGSLLTRVHARLSNDEPQMVTGIVKHPGTEFLSSEGKSWSYIATFGGQSLVPDHLGMAVFYLTASAARITDDGKSYVLVFNPGAQDIHYGFLAAWEQGGSGVKDIAEFRNLLERQLTELNRPLSVSLAK